MAIFPQGLTHIDKRCANAGERHVLHWLKRCLSDDAQSIYQKKRRKFNFASVGIQAQGRTSILKLNYRNTAEVLALAMHCARSLLADRSETDEAMPSVLPATAGRRGPVPVLLLLADQPQAEAELIAQRIQQAVAAGRALDEMAVLCRIKSHMNGVARALRRNGLAVQSMNDPGFRAFDWTHPSIKLLTLRAEVNGSTSAQQPRRIPPGGTAHPRLWPTLMFSNLLYLKQ